MPCKKTVFLDRIITYNGERVNVPDYNDKANVGKIQCSCSRIMQEVTWKLHTKRPICLEFHTAVNRLASYEYIKL